MKEFAKTLFDKDVQNRMTFLTALERDWPDEPFSKRVEEEFTQIPQDIRTVTADWNQRFTSLRPTYKRLMELIELDRVGAAKREERVDEDMKDDLSTGHVREFRREGRVNELFWKDIYGREISQINDDAFWVGQSRKETVEELWKRAMTYMEWSEEKPIFVVEQAERCVNMGLQLLGYQNRETWDSERHSMEETRLQCRWQGLKLMLQTLKAKAKGGYCGFESLAPVPEREKKRLYQAREDTMVWVSAEDV